MHLRMVGVEGPSEVANHLLAGAARRLPVGLLGILRHHDVLIHVGSLGPCAQVDRVVCLLARGALYDVAAKIKLLLGAGVLVALHLLVLVLGLQRRVQAAVARLLSLVKINGRVMEFQIGKLLSVSRAAGAGRIHRSTLLVLTGADVVRVVRGRIHVLVLRHGHGLSVLSLPDRSRAGTFRDLILVMILLIRRRINRLIPPVPRIESAIWRLISYRIRLSAINRVLCISKSIVGSHVACNSIVELALHLLLADALHQAVHH